MKKNTPYENTRKSTVCMYCGEVFTSKLIYQNGTMITISGRKQIEAHYLTNHQKVKHD